MKVSPEMKKVLMKNKRILPLEFVVDTFNVFNVKSSVCNLFRNPATCNCTYEGSRYKFVFVYVQDTGSSKRRATNVPTLKAQL